LSWFFFFVFFICYVIYWIDDNNYKLLQLLFSFLLEYTRVYLLHFHTCLQCIWVRFIPNIILSNPLSSYSKQSNTSSIVLYSNKYIKYIDLILLPSPSPVTLPHPPLVHMQQLYLIFIPFSFQVNITFYYVFYWYTCYRSKNHSDNAN
jgi:hypothetical protein